MSACPTFQQLLILPHIRVQNANAVSSPLTHGFPSITAFLGLMWALERKCRAAGMDVSFPAIGVVCHDHDEQVTDGGYVKAFCLTRNPVSKDGSTAAIVEQGRIHLEVSLVLAVRSERWLGDTHLQNEEVLRVADMLSTMRVAGGSVLHPHAHQRRRAQPRVVDLTGVADDRRTVFRKACMQLLPGFALVSRDDLLEARWESLKANEPQATRLDAWLSLARTNWHYQPNENTTEDKPARDWKHDRAGLGWIRPIPVGYGALGPVHPSGSVVNARDATTSFRFVESLYSMGQWIGPHRLQDPSQLLWYADSQVDAGLYRCRNDFTPPSENLEIDLDF